MTLTLLIGLLALFYIIGREETLLSFTDTTPPSFRVYKNPLRFRILLKSCLPFDKSVITSPTRRANSSASRATLKILVFQYSKSTQRYLRNHKEHDIDQHEVWAAEEQVLCRARFLAYSIDPVNDHWLDLRASFHRHFDDYQQRD